MGYLFFFLVSQPRKAASGSLRIGSADQLPYGDTLAYFTQRIAQRLIAGRLLANDRSTGQQGHKGLQIVQSAKAILRPLTQSDNPPSRNTQILVTVGLSAPRGAVNHHTVTRQTQSRIVVVEQLRPKRLAPKSGVSTFARAAASQKEVARPIEHHRRGVYRDPAMGNHRHRIEDANE